MQAVKTKEGPVKKHRFVPSPALVVALVALFVALGGTSYAAITALPANSVGTTQLKSNAVTGPKIKDGAITAAKISSSAGGAFKVVGKAGAPAYQNSWHASTGKDEGVSFYKDAFGIVHLQGSTTTGIAAVKHGSASPNNSRISVTSTIFTLPPGYRPVGNLWFAAYGGGGSGAYIEVTSAGDVTEVFGSATYIGLGNVTFRAGV
jgi:hypothetical protein